MNCRPFFYLQAGGWGFYTKPHTAPIKCLFLPNIFKKDSSAAGNKNLDMQNGSFMLKLKSSNDNHDCIRKVWRVFFNC